MTFYVNTAERMRIDSAGKVGIGTVTPNNAAQLTVDGGTLTPYGLLSYGNDVGGFFSAYANGCATYVAYANYGAYSACPNGFASDRRLKTDIVPMRSALDTIGKLNPVTFHWRDGTDQARSHKELQFGLIAQDVQKVIPELVGVVELSNLPTAASKGSPSLNQKLGKTYALDYQSLIPFALAAIKELKAANENQAAEIIEMRNEIKAFKALYHSEAQTRK
jgi:hypothetical protein